MKNEPLIQNKTHEFIGRLALLLFSRNIKMSYSALIQVLKDNDINVYCKGRGVAREVSSAYKYWQEIEKDCNIPTTCGAISNTFVGKDGKPAWGKP